jgi:hypothetical protein
MVQDIQAGRVFQTVSDFYKGGLKSGNKKYDAGAANSSSLGSVEFTRRQTSLDAKLNALQSAGGMEAQRKGYKGRTLFSVGKSLFLSANTSGNCGDMAAVAMFVAIGMEHVPESEVVHRTAVNNNFRFGFNWNNPSLPPSRATMTFGHSWLVLGTPGSDRWCVDPWANLFTRERNYADDLLAKLAEWHNEGKRICVNWEDFLGTGSGSWLVPTDDSLRALVSDDRTVSDLGPNSVMR